MSKPHLYDYYEQDELIHESVTMTELSEITGRSRQSISAWSSKGIKSKRIEHVGFVHRMYELFGENGESIMRGTIDQMAEELNYQKTYIEKMLQQGRKDNGGKRLVPLKELWRERFIPVEFEPVAPSELTNKPKIRRAVKETWKPSKHSRMLFEFCFKGWGLNREN